MADSNQAAPASAWLAQNVRLTFFHHGEHGASPRGWFKKVTGSDPDETVERGPRTQELGSYGSPEEVVKGKLVVGHVATRTDWVLVSEDVPTSQKLPRVGEFQPSVSKLRQLIDPWLKDAPAIQRVAVGATLLQAAETPEEGQDRILSYLPGLKKYVHDGKDLFFQINRRQPAEDALPGMALNRLTKWSTVAFIIYDVAVGGMPHLPPTPRNTAHAAQLEIDFSTLGEWEKELPRDEVPKLLDRLIAAAERVAEVGDREGSDVR